MGRRGALGRLGKRWQSREGSWGSHLPRANARLEQHFRNSQKTTGYNLQEINQA